MFGPKRDDVTGKWWKLHVEEIHNLYSSPKIIRMIKSRMMRWAGHVARMGDINAFKNLVGKTSGNGDGPTTCLYLLIYSILQP
jgi:hypothetical protein